MKQKLFTLLTLALLGISSAWAQTLIYSNGFENGTDSWTKSSMGSATSETTTKRTGGKSLSYACSNVNGYARKSLTYTKGYYIHAIMWAKSTTNMTFSLKLNGDESSSFSVSSSGWTRLTHSYNYTSNTASKNTDVLPHSASGTFYLDDVVVYYGSSSTTDITAPTSATAPSATETEISWTNGSDTGDGATGIQNTLIFKRTSGSADDLTLNDQGIYSLTSTEGPSTDQSGHWTLVTASVAADATSFSGTFTAGDRYAIVHRDLAYNYSTPTYVTVTPAGPSLTVDPATASAFSYLAGFGPSASQSFGLTLANSSKAITATLAGDYEMSTDGETYSSSAIEDLTDGSTLYVRLKGNLSSGDHDGTLTLSNDDLASDVVIDLDGSVLASSTVTFANAVGATGIAPAAQTVETGTNITLPKNFTMYKSDCTFTGWDEDGDGDVDYEGGASYPVTDDATLTAVFESNAGTTLADRTVATEVKFDFMQQDGAPSVTWSSGDHFWVAQATVGGKTIDVKADIAFGSGLPKFDNSAWNDWAQINDKTTFTIPSANGASVEMISYNQDETTTVAGTTLTSTGSTGNYTCTAAISSVASTVDVAFSGAGSYYKYIKVTLPGPTYDVDFTLTGVTKTTGEASVEGGTEYTATFAAAEGYVLPASVTVTAGGSDITANCTWAKATGTLTIPAAYVTGDIAITIEGMAVAGTSIIKAVLQSSSSATITGTVGGSYTADSQVQTRDNGKGGCKLGKDGAWVCITLTSGWKFKAGDIVKVNIGTAGSGGTFAFYKESEGTNAILTTDEGPTAGLHTFVLPAAANNEASLYLVRKADSNFNPYVDYIEVIRPVSVTVGANGYTTFASPAILDLTDANRPAGLKAYKATRDGASLTFTALNQTVPAGTGLLLLGETKGGTYYISSAASGTTVESNALVGVTKPTAKQSIEDDTYYFVMKKAASAESALEFLPLSTASAVTIPAGKAYIEVPNSAFGGGGAHDLTFTFEDASGDVTGVTTVAKPQTTNNASFYDLQGRRVAQPTKGLYIVNGKKVIVK